jgi:acetamidase/formamidase
MITHRFTPKSYSNVMGPVNPVLNIAPGDRVITTTLDAHGYNEHMEMLAQKDNPLTGPFFIEGAKPGGTLVVELEITCPNRDTGWSSSTIAPNVVDPSYVRELPVKEYRDWKIDRGKKRVTLVDVQKNRPRLNLPLSPMLGCIGVAPPDGQTLSTTTAGVYGGNMDYRGCREGTTLYFPIFAEGALLFMGDGHALQGDGELSGSGIEVSFVVQFRVDLLEGKEIHWPRGEDSDHIFTVGNARPLEGAVQHASTEMLRWLQTDYSIDIELSSMLLGQGAVFELGNVFDPAYTMVCKINKNTLNTLKNC